MTSSMQLVTPRFDFDSAFDRLNFSRTIDKTLVHRRALAEVFITDFEISGRDRYLVAAQLPVGHAYYNDSTTDFHDPLAIIEACRQAALVVSHQYYGVPKDWSFIFRKAKVHIGNTDSTTISNGRMIVGINITKTFEKDGYLTGIIGDFIVEIEGNRVGEFVGSLSFLPSALLGQMRAQSRSNKQVPIDTYISPLAPLPSKNAARTWTRNIVIGRTTRDTYEIVDRRNNRALIDHEVDHISGMVILEACRQAAIATVLEETDELYCTVTSYQIEFLEFAEHEFPTLCKVHLMDIVDGVAQTHIEILQQNQILASAQIDLVKG